MSADNHGNTPAAWTAVVVALVGFAVGGAGLMLDPLNYTVFWIGVGIVLVSGLIYVVMNSLAARSSAH